MRRRLWLALAAAWLGWTLTAGAGEPIVLAFTGIMLPPEMKTDANMNRVFAEELAARGIEVHFISPLVSWSGPDLDAVFYGEAVIERTGVTRVRSSRGDSPVTETMSFARCNLSVSRYDEDGNSKSLFHGAVIVPLSGEPPELVPAVPSALAERIADVIEAAGLEEPRGEQQAESEDREMILEREKSVGDWSIGGWEVLAAKDAEERYESARSAPNGVQWVHDY